MLRRAFFSLFCLFYIDLNLNRRVERETNNRVAHSSLQLSHQLHFRYWHYATKLVEPNTLQSDMDSFYDITNACFARCTRKHNVS